MIGLFPRGVGKAKWEITDRIQELLEQAIDSRCGYSQRNNRGIKCLQNECQS